MRAGAGESEASLFVIAFVRLGLALEGMTLSLALSTGALSDEYESGPNRFQM